MKMLVIALSLLVSAVSFAQELEIHFDESLLNKCTKEVAALGCGQSAAPFEEALMKCVDLKILQLSEDCQSMHKTIRANPHSH